MKKFSGLFLCLLLFASVFAYAQNATKARSDRTDKAAKAAADPFGADPAAGEATDPFAPAPPKKRKRGVDPFGGGEGYDPFAAPRQVEAKPRPPLPGTPRNTPVAADIFPVTWLGSSAATQRIDRILAEEASVECVDQPLLEVMEDITHRHELPIVFDTKALDNFGIDRSVPISISLRRVSLRSALRLILEPLELTYMTRDEVLLITTPEEAEAQLATGFYVVSELLPETGDSKWLLDLIRHLVAPDTWDEVGGPGAMIYIEHRETLAISQTADVHTHIRQLLAALSKLPKKGE